MRARLSAVALDLAIEHGVTGVRIEQIASAAGVSPRTFNNYFPSKEAAIVGVAAIRADVFRAALRARPADEPLPEALRAAAAALFEDEPDRAWMARSRLIRSERSLFAEERKSDIEVERVLAAEIGDRTGTDPHVDLAPRLAAATVIAAIHTAVQYWLDVPTAGTLREVVERAIVDCPLGGAEI
ncbi:TetR family transcriptional regulator [Mycolicibacterium neoaurum]|uniref:TetR family transcriptional regulator n=2 Tax=Mycobacteriaceae TaxID=1762 RepID=A0AAV2WE11_MYCNE|nr:TetR family transcriptional regulator [Mycolicibacterium neoaurum]CDQ42502.1 TetR family transcriptional regulator [Mycolicibacterium neoaurum]